MRSSKKKWKKFTPFWSKKTCLPLTGGSCAISPISKVGIPPKGADVLLIFANSKLINDKSVDDTINTSLIIIALHWSNEGESCHGMSWNISKISVIRYGTDRQIYKLYTYQ